MLAKTLCVLALFHHGFGEGPCPNGWRSYSSFCYWFSDDSFTWDEARAVCQARTADHVSMADAAETRFIENEVKRIAENHWMGLTNINLAAKSGTWTDGTPWNNASRNWADGEPNNDEGTELCGQLRRDGKWNDNQCDNNFRYICKRSNTVPERCDIEDGWHGFGSRCYKLFAQLEEWSDARALCQQQRGDLMVIDTTTKLNYLRNTLICQDKRVAAWIGLSDTDTPSVLTWVNGDQVGVNNWAPGQPVMGSGGQSCTEVVTADQFRWKISPCMDRKMFVCSRPQGRCAEGWIQWRSMCYLARGRLEQKMTWTDAVKYCQKAGATPLKITSQEESDGILKTLTQLMASVNNGGMWLGISDSSADGVFKWFDGTDVTYRKWNPGQPANNAGRMDCAHVPTAPSNNQKWTNSYCFLRRPVICQIPLGRAPTPVIPEPTHECLDSGWINFGDKCYYFFNNMRKRWVDALNECRKRTAELAMIPDVDVQSFISGNIGTKQSWVGLKKESGNFVWIGLNNKQTPMTFTNWDNNQPNPRADACVKVKSAGYTAGLWITPGCYDFTDGFICEKPASPKINPPPVRPTFPPSPLCGDNWVYDAVGELCYQLNMVEQTWADARKVCQQRSSDLLSIGGLHEQSFVSVLLMSTGALHFWTGGNALDLDAGWRWTDGTAFRYFNWNPGSPDTSGAKLCMEMQPSSHAKWVTASCSNQYYYVCKKGSQQYSTPKSPHTTLRPPACHVEPFLSGNRYIQDEMFTAKSSASGADPSRSRIRSSNSGPTQLGGWQPTQDSQEQWIQADFMIPTAIFRMWIKGMSGTGRWVTQYRMRYQFNYGSMWEYVRSADGSIIDFSGNTDDDTQVENQFPQPVRATLWRLYPRQWHSGIGLRWELLGCYMETCRNEDTMTGRIVVPDSTITASSTLDNSHRPVDARLRFRTPAMDDKNGWSPATNDLNQWIMVELPTVMRIRGFFTKGRKDSNLFVKKYKIQFSRDGNTFKDYEQPHGRVMQYGGNSNNNGEKQNWAASPFAAKFVKLIPLEWTGGIGIRWEVSACLIGCDPVAMVSGTHKLPDSALTASSSANDYQGPARSRFNMRAEGQQAGAWVAGAKDQKQWIQADLGTTVLVHAISTKGREERDEWTKSFVVTYSQDGTNWFSVDQDGQRKVFAANWDRGRDVKAVFPSPVRAQYIRLWPQTWNAEPALRWEIWGCPGPLGGTQIGCFSDSWRVRDLPYSVEYNPQGGMTQELCISKCYHHGYLFAGLQNGMICFCGNSYGRYGPSQSCTMKCSGDAIQLCGGKHANLVFNTGLGPGAMRCPDSWRAFGNNCFRPFKQPQLVYAEAENYCMQQGGHLAVLNYQQDAEFVAPLIKDNEVDMWIGLNDQRYSYLFEWVDGSPVLYTNWGKDEPRGNQDGRCIYQSQNDGEWYAATCNEQKSFLCYQPKSPQQIVSPPQPPDGCDQGWVASGGSCYLFYPSTRSWAGGRDDCAAFGGTLARVDDRFEQLFLSAELHDQEAAFEWWIDVTDQGSPGQYHNSNGSRIPFTNWAYEEPKTQPDGSSCVAMKIGEDAGYWFVRKCNTTRASLCEKDRVGYTKRPGPTTPASSVPCEAGWTTWGANCFQLNDVPGVDMLTWEDARADCVAKGGDLASFHNATEHDFIFRLAMQDSPVNMWIGLNSREPDKGHQWSDGSPVDFTAWAPGEPNNQGNELCMELYKNKMWNDKQCAAKRNWVCKIPRGTPVLHPVTTTAPPPGPPGSCSPDTDEWKMFNGRCFFFNDQRASFHDAEVWCNSQGGNLASIHTQLENRFIQGQTKYMNVGAMWIGLNDLDITKGYRWTDGTAVEYRNWKPGEPNDAGGNEACVNFYKENGMWNDEVCSRLGAFICAKYKGGQPPVTTTPSPLPGNCPAGFKEYGDKCFQFNYEGDDAQKTWDEASQACKARGQGGSYQYYLASIANAQESAFITTNQVSTTTSLWIGLRMLRDGVFSWIDNSKVTYTNWYRGEPNGGTREQCVEAWSDTRIDRSGLWNDAVCSLKRGYICMTYKQPDIATPPPTTNPCSAGFSPFNGDCYLLQQSASNWQQAVDGCKQQGGSLTSIISPYEQAFIYSWLASNKVNPAVWIGLSDNQKAGHFRFVDGWPVRYVNWDEGQPNYENGGCVRMQQNGTWLDSSCTDQLPSVCKQSTVTPNVTHAPPVGTCPESIDDTQWIPFGTSCYAFFPKLIRSFVEADFECQNRGSHLASLHSDADVMFATAHLADLSITIWIGLFKPPHGSFQWKDGSPVEYTNWNTKEPNNARGNEDCTELLATGKWNDNPCLFRHGFICKTQQTLGRNSTVTIPDRTPSSRSTTDVGIEPRSTTPYGPIRQSISGTTVSGAELGAILMAVLCMAGIVTFLVYFFRRERQKQVPRIEVGASDSTGFDNALYASGQDEVKVN